MGSEIEFEGVIGHELAGEAVIGRYGDIDVGAQAAPDALSQLGRRLVGEGQREQLIGTGAVVGHQAFDPSGDCLGLTGACTGDDQQRVIVMIDDASLFGRGDESRFSHGVPRSRPAFCNGHNRW